MRRLVEFAVGMLFGLGLILSGMTDPGKVLGFLDLAGLWDPSLALVMGGAVAVGLFGFRAAKRRQQSILGDAMHWPPAQGMDRGLVLGAMMFGAGWGLAGFCPGPAWVAMSAGYTEAWVFGLAMLVGMGLFELRERLRIKR
jgi:uncharacterized membrane protein YedE/YeeE